MFEEEFGKKLQESMHTPREVDFDEGAWASLEQQLEAVGGAAGSSLVGGAGAKAAFWGIKGWLTKGAIVVLLGTTGFFFYKWQQAEKGFEDLQISRLEDEGNEEMRKLEDEGMRGFEDGGSREGGEVVEGEMEKQFAHKIKVKKREIFELEEKERRLQQSIQDKLAWLASFEAENEGRDFVSKEQKEGLFIEKAPFLTPALSMPHTLEWEQALAVSAIPYAEEDLEKIAFRPLRFAIEGSLSSMNSDSLQPFNGKATGLRGEFWFRRDLAVYIGIQQQVAEAKFLDQDVDPIRDDFRPLNTQSFRNDSLLVANLSKREYMIPVGLRFVPYQNLRFKVYTGGGIIFQKTTEKEVWLTFHHEEHFPPWPPRSYEYTVRREEEVGPIKLAYAFGEVGTRVKLTPHTELEIGYAYQQEVKPNLSPYYRKRGHKVGSSLIFSF
jgi:hypothetical protein